MAKEHSFRKKEKLKSRKLVDDLFSSGKSANFFPIRMVYKLLPASIEESSMQAGVTASSRHFKRAVDRNRIKRLLREAYRLQKKELLLLKSERKINGYAFFIYTDKVMPTFETVYKAMTKCLLYLQKKASAPDESTG